MRARVRLDGLGAVLASMLAETAEDVTEGIADGTEYLKEDLRDQVRAADMGPSLPTTWRGEAYPKSGASLDAAGVVWSKAPKIISSFSTGRTIRPVGRKKYLWLATENVPRALRHSPERVKAYFRRDFDFRRSRRGNLLAFIQRRPKEPPMLMFVLLREVPRPKRFDLDAAAERGADHAARSIERRRSWRE